MYINSTIHPYHSIAKSKVHPNQPFLKSICYYIRIEERERKRKGRKKEVKNKHTIALFQSKNHAKLRPTLHTYIHTIKKKKKSQLMEFQK